MCDDTIKLGSICATCTHGRFQSASDYGKKMGGLCMLNTDRQQPKKVWFMGSDILWKQLTDGNAPTVEGFIEQSKRYWWGFVEGRVEKFTKYYNDLVAAHTWWTENSSKMRKTHRSCTCDCWELDTTNRREQGARTIVKHQGDKNADTI